jgi:site-specific recombinase XerD
MQNFAEGKRTGPEGPELQPEPPFFVSKANNQRAISERALQGQINKVLQKMSLILGKRIRSPIFRTTLVTDLLANGLPLHKIRDILGYANSGTAPIKSITPKKEIYAAISKISQYRQKDAFGIKSSNGNERPPRPKYVEYAKRV